MYRNYCYIVTPYTCAHSGFGSGSPGMILSDAPQATACPDGNEISARWSCMAGACKPT